MQSAFERYVEMISTELEPGSDQGDHVEPVIRDLLGHCDLVEERNQINHFKTVTLRVVIKSKGFE